MSLKVFSIPVLVHGVAPYAADPCPRAYTLPSTAGVDAGLGVERQGGQLPAAERQASAALGARPEELSFERVYEDHFSFAWRSLRLLGVAHDALEDAAQDVFAVVSRQLPEFAGRSSIGTWIFAIVQHTAANYRRKHRRKLKPLVPLADVIVGHEPTPQAHAEASEVALVIERFCASLSPDRRALFVLALMEDVPAPEVSRVLGIPINTVYSRVRALRAGIERALGRGEEEHG
jgi:RNA polymerase sigma-70 factor, ECF subfamily